MCNINIVLKKDIENKKINRKVFSLMSSATSHSFIHNHDGEGFYFDGTDKVIKSKNKIDLTEHIGDMSKSLLIMAHERFSTHGNTEEFIHPFSNDDFVLVHNGVLHSFVEKYGESDTFGFFKQFVRQFNELEKGTREDRIIQSIKLLLDDLDWGSYSIAIWDKKDRYLYYFKNYQTEINIFGHDDFLFITTNSDNKEFLKYFEGKIVQYNPKNRMIYQIKEDLSIWETSFISLKEVSRNNNIWVNDKRGGVRYSKKENNRTFNSIPRNMTVRSNDIIISTDTGECDVCGRKTNRMTLDYRYLCEWCEKRENKGLSVSGYGGYIG